MAKGTRFTFRTTDEFKKRIKAISDELKIDQSVIAEAAIEALIRHVEDYGEITIPVKIVPPGRSEKKTGDVRSATGGISSRTVLHGTNEPSGRYKTKSRGKEKPPGT